MMDQVLASILPGVGALLIAIAAWIQQHLKGKQTEKATRETNTIVDELRREITELERKEHGQKRQLEELEQREERHKEQLKDLHEEILECESTSTRAQVHVQRLQDQVRIYQEANAELNTRTVKMIQELEKLNENLKDQTIKFRREPAIL